MQVTDASFFPVNNGPTVALGQVILDKVLKLNVKIMNGKNGLWVAFPSKLSQKDNKYYSDFNFIDKDAHADFSTAVLSAYHTTNSQGNGSPLSRNSNSEAEIMQDDLPF